MNDQSKKVSVLIPCYNQAALIRPVVEAILAQTRLPDEIIVVDDASQDTSLEILRTLPVKIIQHETNLGLSRARNSAIAGAAGDILVFVDGDAIAAPDLIEVLLSGYQLSDDGNLGGIGGRGIEALQLNVYDRWRAYHASQSHGNKPVDDVPFLYGLCMSYTRRAIEKVGGFDPFFSQTCGEDIDIGIRLHQAGYRLGYLPQAVVYHQHSDDEKRLLKTHSNWAYWNYLLKKRHSLPTWKAYAGIFRRLFTESVTDLIVRRDVELFTLDLKMFRVKLSAIRKAARLT
ncbi:MAG TPA: glycosyltransferase [Anaerolineales bacterium]|nr:glycosyltransferase [Anaerolineales bacterium]